MQKTALLFGATGLVGGHVLRYLIRNPAYKTVKVFTRREIPVSGTKIKTIRTDFSGWDEIQAQLSGDELYCCLGTTHKKAGSKKAFREIDYGIPLKLASMAEKNHVAKFLVISSVGSNPDSNNHYLRTKGEMERDIQKYSFQRLVILRPSLLTGKREEFRLAEATGEMAMKAFGFLLTGSLKKYKPIEATKVARCMIYLANTTTGQVVIGPEELQQMEV